MTTSKGFVQRQAAGIRPRLEATGVPKEAHSWGHRSLIRFLGSKDVSPLQLWPRILFLPLFAEITCRDYVWKNSPRPAFQKLPSTMWSEIMFCASKPMQVGMDPDFLRLTEKATGWEPGYRKQPWQGQRLEMAWELHPKAWDLRQSGDSCINRDVPQALYDLYGAGRVSCLAMGTWNGVVSCCSWSCSLIFLVIQLHLLWNPDQVKEKDSRR